MLRRNMDTKKGLVNSAIGTVLSISNERVNKGVDTGGGGGGFGGLSPPPDFGTYGQYFLYTTC